MSNKHAYGTKEYWQEEIKRAELSKVLINEAIANRLKDGMIQSHEMRAYVEAIEEAEQNVAYRVGQLEKSLEEANNEKPV